MIYCFSVQLVSLNQVMENALFETACIMVREGSQRKKFERSGCQGVVTTYFKNKTLNGVWGVEFFADIDTPFGSGNAHFIVRQEHIDMRNEVTAQIGRLVSAAGRQKPMYN